MRAATRMKRTINKNRLRYLTPAQVAEAHQHPTVQKLLQKKLALKAWIKARGRTINSYISIDIHEEYLKRKRAYETAFKF
jgi:Protein of unknown function (DUF3435)